MSIYYEHFKSSIQKNRKGIDYYNRFKLGKGVANEDVGSIYKAILHQRGYGLRDFDEINGYGFWNDLWEIGKPMLTKGLKYLGSLGVDAVSDIAHNALEGKNIRESAKERFEKVKDDIVAQVPGAIRSVFGNTNSPEYKRRGKKRKPNSQQSPGAIVASARKKRSQESFPGLKFLK